MTDGDVARALAAPVSQVGARLLALPENQWFDRKSFRIEPRKLVESLVSFANADGGTIVIGLSGGVIEGVDADSKHLNELMQTAIKLTEPTVAVEQHLVECENSRGAPDRLLIVEVLPGGVLHATMKDDAFLRVGDENHRLTFAQRRELLYDKSQSTYEAESTRAPTAHDVDQGLLATYVDAIGAGDAQRLLAARGLANDSVLTVAGLLLFGTHPERYLPSAQVRICRFRGARREYGSRQNLLRDERLEGPIPRLISDVAATVRSWQPTRRALTPSGRFTDVALVPEDAWLEGVVNAVVHRSYSIHGDHIHVDIYDDRIAIESPGRFPGIVDLAEPLAMTRFARNPRIARVCTDLGITQELGEGIRRMFQEMRAAGLSDPLYHQSAGSVQLTLTGVPTERRLTGALPSVQQRILTVLRETESLSTGEIAEALGVARPTVLRHLGQLRDAGYLEWVGKSTKDPRASWQLRQ